MKSESWKRLPKPRYYLDERRAQIKVAIGKDTSPRFLGDPYDAAHNKEGGWVTFVLVKEQVEVSLRIPFKGQPYRARQEWLVRHVALQIEGQRSFDVHSVIQPWNAGGDPKLSVKDCGSVHLSGSRTVAWDHMAEALKIWASSGQRGIYPPDLAAILDPDRRLPFLTPPIGDHTPPENRWIHVGINMLGPLDDQLRDLRERLRRLQQYLLLLSGRKPKRSAARETGRDVLIYTFHYSAGLTVSEIASLVFTNEKQESAQAKVKKRLTLVRKAIKGVETKPQP